MKSIFNNLILSILFFSTSANGADNVYLYKGTFSRTIKVSELYRFNTTKKPSNKLKSLMKITNLKKEELYKILSFKIEAPLKASNRLLNSKIGGVFLSRLSKIVYPNKISDKELSNKAIKSGIILSSYNNNQKINFVDFLKAYPNKNVAIDLNALSKALKKVESLTELIEYYSNSPLKKLKDGSSSI